MDTQGGSTKPDGIAARLIELADDATLQWVPSVETAWPTPIAHEYARLRSELRGGSIASVLWQFKDLVEVLVRLPALVLARGLIEHGSPDQQYRTRRSLLSGPLTLGAWLKLLRDDLSPAVLAGHDRFHPLLVGVAAQLIDPVKGGKTAWAKFLAELVSWRNSDFAHGSFRLNGAEYLPTLERFCPLLNAHFTTQDRSELWARGFIATLDGGVILKGASGLVDPNWQATVPGHREVPLFLMAGPQAPILGLMPFLTLRRCTICSHLDVFCFDGRSGTGERGALGFMDFAKGHSFTLPPHVLPDLAGFVASTPAVDPGESDLGDDFSDRTVEAALDRATLRSRYLSPAYLRKPLAKLLGERTKGIIWLRAPGHVGKSTFVRGLAAPQEVGEGPLADDIFVAALHIRREFRSSALQAQDFLENDLVRQVMKIGARVRRLQFDPDSPDPAGAFVEFLSEAMRVTSQSGRLLLCFDGLDEAVDGAAIIDWIPRADALPEDVFLLVTSRPLADCPPPIALKLSHGLARDPAVAVLDVDAGSLSEGYKTFARSYFDREAAPTLLSQMHAGLADFVARHREGAKLVCRDDLSAILPPALKERVRADWRQLTDGMMISTPPGAVRASSAIAPVLTQNEAVFATLLAASQGRLQFLALLSQLHGSGALDGSSIDGLVDGRALYQRYIGQIGQSLGSEKLRDLVRRLILVASAEAVASEWMRSQSGQDWPAMDGGLDLAQLAQRLGMVGRPARLALLVFELQQVFVVTPDAKGQASRYAVAHSDFIAAVHDRWRPELVRTHAILAGRAIEAADAGEDLGSWANEELCGVVAHAVIAGVARDRLPLDGPLSTLISDRARIAHDEGRYNHAVALTSVAIVLAEQHLLHRGERTPAWCLAMHLRHRAIALSAAGQVARAQQDVDRSLALFRDLLGRADPATRPLLEREVAETLPVKAGVEGERGHWQQALAYYGDSLSLLEGATDPRLPDANDLVGRILHNRARLYGLMGDEMTALAELDALVEGLSALAAESSDSADQPPTRLAEALVLRSVAHLAAGGSDQALDDARRGASLLLPGGPKDVQQGALPANVMDGAARALAQLSRVYGACYEFTRAFEVNGFAIELQSRILTLVGSDAGPSLRSPLMRMRSDRAMLLFERKLVDEAVIEIGEAIELGRAIGRDAHDEWTAADRESLGLSYCMGAVIRSEADGIGSPLVAAYLAEAEALGVPTQQLDRTRSDIATPRLSKA